MLIDNIIFYDRTFYLQHSIVKLSRVAFDVYEIPIFLNYLVIFIIKKDNNSFRKNIDVIML